eukprot:scaffold180455_cov45-Prasinocladus_malaysianus.AAC.2
MLLSSSKRITPLQTNEYPNHSNTPAACDCQNEAKWEAEKRHIAYKDVALMREVGQPIYNAATTRACHKWQTAMAAFASY